MTGHFSLANAAFSFGLVGGGGVLVGLGVTFAIGRLNRALIKRAGEEPATQILVSLLMPFAAYLAAEHLHVSGILAAAVAGIAMHYGELAGRALAATRMQRNAVWDTVQATLNGIIFVLLGQQLPHFVARLPGAASEIGVKGVPLMLGYLSAITAALIALRFLWVWIAMHVTVLRAARKGQQRRKAPTRVLAVTATAGVRGAITLAGILTLPTTLPSGEPFPARDVAIFLAMGVILLSLLFATVMLPILTRSLATLPGAEGSGAAARRTSEANARTAAAEAAVRRIERLLSEPTSDGDATVARAEAAMHLLAAYRRRLEYGDPHEDENEAQRVAAAERELHLRALQAEREELYRIRLDRGIDDDVHRALLREIDLVEASLTPAGNH